MKVEKVKKMNLQDKKTVMIIITLVILAVTAGGASFIFIDKLLTPSEKMLRKTRKSLSLKKIFLNSPKMSG